MENVVYEIVPVEVPNISVTPSDINPNAVNGASATIVLAKDLKIEHYTLFEKLHIYLYFLSLIS